MASSKSYEVRQRYGLQNAPASVARKSVEAVRRLLPSPVGVGQRYSVIRLSASCCMREMQAPAWLPVIVQDIDLAARLRSNGQSRTRRIPGMAARQIRQ